MYYKWHYTCVMNMALYPGYYKWHITCVMKSDPLSSALHKVFVVFVSKHLICPSRNNTKVTTNTTQYRNALGQNLNNEFKANEIISLILVYPVKKGKLSKYIRITCYRNCI